MKKRAENRDISIEPDDENDFQLESDEEINGTLQGKLKKLRDELKEVRKERDENLAGWQRSKADLVNFRRTVEEDREKYKARAKGSLIQSLLPALDTFDAAMNDPSWQSVDESWRQGVERIAHQLHSVLKEEGLQAFGTVGDVFDPNIHECMSMTEAKNKKEDGTVAQVLQQGYKVNGELIRPAKVVVAQLEEK